MGEFADHDQEDYEAGDPRVVFVRVHYFVAEKRHQEGCGRDDDDAGPARHIAVDCVYELGADDDVDGRPADARQDVEYGNWTGGQAISILSRAHHLAFLC